MPHPPPNEHHQPERDLSCPQWLLPWRHIAKRDSRRTRVFLMIATDLLGRPLDRLEKSDILGHGVDGKANWLSNARMIVSGRVSADAP